MDFWMVWVAGTKAPQRIYPTREDAMRGVRYLRQKHGATQEIYLLRPIETIPGRKILKLNHRPSACLVERT